jgi:competence protein ComEC
MNTYFLPENAGLAVALLIGNTQQVDNELLEAYSNTGITHIIAISGMHMQLIIGCLLWLFG